MDTPHTSHTATGPAALNLSTLLFDRASLEGLECLDSGWDEWDTCVAEQDLFLALCQVRQVRSSKAH